MTARRVAAALVAVGALTVLVDWGVGRLSLERHRADIERELSEALGLDVRLGGELRFDLLPTPALEATEVVVANPPERVSPELLRIVRLRLVVALRPLLRRQIELVRLEVDGADLRLETGSEGGPDLLPAIARLFEKEDARDASFAVRIDRIDLDDGRVAWQDVGSGAVTTLAVDAFDVVAEADEDPIEWSVRGSFRGEPFGFDGRGGTFAALLHSGAPWPLTLDGHAGDATLRLRGAISDPARLEGLDLDVEVELADVGSLLGPASARPGLGAARLRGHWTDPGGEHRLDRIVVESDPDAELRLRASGSVRRLADPSGIELDGELESDRLRVLALLVKRPMPEGRLLVGFQLSDRDGTLGVEGEAHAESRDGSLRVDLSGGCGDLRTVDELDATLRIAAPSLDGLGRAAGIDWELPALGPVRASTRLRDRAGRVGVDGLELEAGRRDGSWLALSGSVRDLEAFRGVALEIRASARSLAAFARALRPPRSLPELGPFDLRAKLADARGPVAVERFELRGGTPETLAVDLAGSVADLRQLDAIEVGGGLHARDASVLGSLFDLELPAVGPVAFDGHARGSDERIETEGSAGIGATRIEVRGSAEVAHRERPRIAAELHSAHLRLEDIGLGPPAAERRERERGDGPSRARGLRDLEELRRLDARLEIRADRVTAGDSVEVRDARAIVGLEDGDLHLRQVQLEYQGGSVAGELRIDARTPDPALALRAEASALDLARLGEALGEPDVTGSGKLDLSVDLRSRGATPDALRERLSGRAAFAARDWSAASPLARRFLVDLTRAFVRNFRLRAERLGCFRGAATLEDGQARVEGLVLASEHATVVGSGSIDLVRERVDLELVPEIHDPGLLEVASAVRATGPLLAPRFKPVPHSVVAGAIRGLARGALSPARKLTAGTQRMLGPVGRILSPLRSGLALGSGNAEDAAACVLPELPEASSCIGSAC